MPGLLYCKRRTLSVVHCTNYKKIVNPYAKKLLMSMGFKRHTGNLDQDYIDTYVPTLLQHMDRGRLTLIKPAYFPYAKALMEFCQEVRKQVVKKQV